MSTEELYRDKHRVETLAARAELLAKLAGTSVKLRAELNEVLAKAYLMLDRIEQQAAGWLFIPALLKRLESITLA